MFEVSRVLVAAGCFCVPAHRFLRGIIQRGAIIIAYTIVGVPSYKFSMIDPQTLF